MKHLYISLIFLLTIAASFSQTTTKNYIKSTSYQVPTQDGNTNAISSSNLQDDDKIETITYFDGLGRPIQSIAKQAGGNKQDIITPVIYDDFGRQAISYLPYANAGQVPGSGSLDFYNQTNLIQNIESHYANKFPEDAISSGVINAYSQTFYEASPLNRVLVQAAPGKNWALSNGQTIKFDYSTNTFNPSNPADSNNDNVLIFNVDFVNGATTQPILVNSGYYVNGELYKTVTKDENWKPNQSQPKDHTTEEFKNKEGQVILKRTFNNGKQHNTYYVYDDFGNLTYVLPPAINTYNSLNQQETDGLNVDLYNDCNIFYDDHESEWCVNFLSIYFSPNNSTLYVDIEDYSNLEAALTTQPIYEFNLNFDLPNINNTNGDIEVDTADGSFNTGLYIQNNKLFFNDDLQDVYEMSGYVSFNFGNLHIPVQVTQEQLNDLAYQYKYDHRNRLIEKKIPGKEWEYIIYNKLDQPILTQDANLAAQNQWLFTKYDVFGRVSYTGLFYSTQSRNNLQSSVNNLNTLNVSKQSVPTSIAGTQVYYNNEAFPINDIVELHTINYYDNYTFDKVDGDSESAFNVVPTTNVQGLVTGSKIRVLDTNQWITNVHYYDNKGRLIYNYSHNDFLDTTDKIKNRLSFDGKTLEVSTEHQKDSDPAITTTEIFEYDHQNRLKKHLQKINNAPIAEVIAENHYDALGQLHSKGVGGKNNAANRLQDVNYNYNIRGWLKGINNLGDIGDKLFWFDINYNKPQAPSTSTLYNIPLYNGNISHVSWQTNNADNGVKHYSYRYDALNRMQNAYFAENDTFNNKFNEWLSYDRNGNIKTLRRFGINPTNSANSYLMDNLHYKYIGNQLKEVKDNANNATANSMNGFLDGNLIGDDYLYDDNGNMIIDKNKGITNIIYNHLNLPTWIEFYDDNPSNNDAGFVAYVYDATGTKLRKTSKYSSLSGGQSTYYAGNYIYEQGCGMCPQELKFLSHPEGYTEPDGQGNFDYIYQYKDHLGNVRLSYKDTNNDGAITGETTQVFFDGFESASGWDGSGNTWGHHVSYFDHNVKKFGDFSARLDRADGNANETVAHSNQWVPINNSVDTEYVYSAWVFLENVTGNWATLLLFMNTNQETGYYTEISEVKTYTRGQWVYIEKRVTVPAHIDKLNIRIGNRSNGFVWFDNVSIKQVNPSENVEIVQENNYYPFGLQHKGYYNAINGTENNFFNYNGKELEKSLSLEWLDLGARMYDPAIGRFMTVDPMADFMNYQSPYVVADNNPIAFIDFYGLGKNCGWLCRTFNRIIYGRQGINADGTKKGKFSNGTGWLLNNRNSSNNSSENNGDIKTNNNNSGAKIIIDSPKIDLGDNVVTLPTSKLPEIQTPNPRRRKPKFGDIEIDSRLAVPTFLNFIDGGLGTNLDEDNAQTNKTLNAIVKTLTDYPQLKLIMYIKRQTHPKDKSNFNLERHQRMTSKRAAAIIKFLEEQGIDPSRVKWDYHPERFSLPGPETNVHIFEIRNDN